MKYVRTKDGRILDLSRYVYDKTAHWYRERIDLIDHLGMHYFCWKDEFDKIPVVFGKPLIEQLDKKECKIADTIEELCDEFVLVGERIAPKHSFLTFEQAKFNFKSLINQTYVDFAIYGAIWTEKGLIYVAKMNNEGKLELL